MRNIVIEMADYFKALGDVTRLMLIKILASHKENTFCVSELAERLHISQPAVSQHLKVLRNVGVVTANRDGNKTFYAIDMDKFVEYSEISQQLFHLARIECDDAMVRGDIPCSYCEKITVSD